METITFESHPIIAKIEQALKENTPKGAYTVAKHRKSSMGGDYVRIAIASSSHQINDIFMQHPDVVSLNLDLNTMELQPQHFGGSGGASILCKPNLDDPKEKYCAYGRLKIPFRQPKATEEAVIKAVERFAQRWTETMKANKGRLAYSQYVNYDELLGE